MSLTDPFVTPAAPSSPRGKSYCGKAKRQSEGTCTRPAGWGTKHVGIGACKLHGGASQSHNVAAQRLEAKALLGTLGVVDDPQSLPPLVVEAELQLSAAKQLAAVRWLERQVGDVRPEQVEVSPWPALLASARRDCDRLLVEMVRLGLDARRVALKEDEQAVLQAFMQGVLDRFAALTGLDMAVPSVRAAAHEALRIIEGETG